MDNRELVKFLATNPIYMNFHETAKALNWQFNHDIFNDLKVPCIFYTPALKKDLVARWGTTMMNNLLKQTLGAYLSRTGIIFINMPLISKSYSEDNIYEIVKTVLEHEYLHAYFAHTNILKKEYPNGKGKNITKTDEIREVRQLYQKEKLHQGYWLEYYLKAYKKRQDYKFILEEEFLIQCYTTQFDMGDITAGTVYFEKLVAIMKDVHPYFSIAKAPRHFMKKISLIKWV